MGLFYIVLELFFILEVFVDNLMIPDSYDAKIEKICNSACTLINFCYNDLPFPHPLSFLPLKD